MLLVGRGSPVRASVLGAVCCRWAFLYYYYYYMPARRARPTQFHVEYVVCPAYRDLACVHAMRARAHECFE